MTPAEILQDLRDIQLPDTQRTAEGFEFALGPFVALAVLLLIVISVQWLRRQRWRKEARKRLDAIAREPTPAQQWAGLLDLLRRVAPHTNAKLPPSSIFLPPGRITDDDVTTLREHIRDLVRR